MAKKRTYKTRLIQQIDAQKLASEVGQRCIVAVDIAKVKMFAGFATSAGQCVEIVRFEHPKQTSLFLTLLTALGELGVALEFVMESTGVYGDALRYQVRRLEIPVFRVDAKKVHDAAELLDGVPSLHDAKACTLLSHLHAQRLSKPWRERTDVERLMRNLIDERDLFARPFEAAYGRLEAMVSRHWPELSEHIQMQRSWHLRLLEAFAAPADICGHETEAVELVRRATRGKMEPEHIQAIVGSAARSLGHPMDDSERALMRALVSHLLELRQKVKKVDQRIEAALSKQPELENFREAFGPTTTAAIVADVGNPSNYESAGAFEKALGMNLKIRSSGEKDGKGSLHITKRGPGRARRYLFFAALRFIQGNDLAKRWYQARKSYLSEAKLKAVVALMRKLARAMVHVAKGAKFDASKLFDARRFAPTSAAEPVTGNTSSTLAALC